MRLCLARGEVFKVLGLGLGLRFGVTMYDDDDDDNECGFTYRLTDFSRQRATWETSEHNEEDMFIYDVTDVLL
jgi:hypothetical protein